MGSDQSHTSTTVYCVGRAQSWVDVFSVFLPKRVSPSIAITPKRMTHEAENLAAARREVLELREAVARGIADREHIENELLLRNAALDAATTHFMLVEARPPNYPIVYVNRVLAADHGYRDPQ